MELRAFPLSHTCANLSTLVKSRARWYDAIGVRQSTFGSINTETHKIRRGALNPFFSRTKVLEMEDIVQDKVAKVCNRMDDASGGEPVDLHHAFRALAVDIISEYAFDNCYNLLDKTDFGAPFFRTLRAFAGPFCEFETKLKQTVEFCTLSDGSQRRFQMYLCIFRSSKQLQRASHSLLHRKFPKISASLPPCSSNSSVRSRT